MKTLKMQNFKKLWWKNICVIGVLLLVIWFISLIFFPSYNQESVEILIPQGADSLRIARILSQHQLIKSPSLFILLSKIFNWEKDLKAGKYELTSPSLIEVLHQLRKGEIKIYRVTIPEGLPKWEVARILTSNGVVKEDVFLRLIDNPQIFKEDWTFPLPKESLEGYLYPDTYYFTRNENPQEVVKKFLVRFEEVVGPLYKNWRENHGLSLEEVITLASIVEKEARVSSEKPIIAAVFYNRLRKGLRLRADPTVKYALGNFRERLTFNELRTPSSYNTYLHHGLPPGPICSPGKDSIYAVLYPAKVDYLYFVAKGNGSHQFSQTYEQHLKAVYKYQKEQVNDSLP
ncbi:MAG: endolytic transglycosylase MltG [bacterium]